jgi:lysyl endopeptidase
MKKFFSLLIPLFGFSLVASASVTENLNSGVNASVSGGVHSAPPAVVASQKAATVERFMSSASSVHAIELAILSNAAMSDEKKKAADASAEKGAPLQIGFGRDVPEALRTIPLSALPWQTLSSGARALKFEVAAPGAAGLRVGYRFDGPADGAELRFSGSANPEVYKARSSQTKELLWSPTMDGERGTVEMSVRAGFDPSQFSLTVERISHLWIAGDDLKGADSRNRALCPGTDQTGIGCSGSCNIDIKCVSNPSQALVDASRATALLTYVSGGGSFLCSGTLLNTRPFTGVPYIFTAAHCISAQAEASALETYWFYDAVGCNSTAAPPFSRITTGSVLLVTDVTMDVTLLRMNDSPPNGAVLAAWDATVIPKNAIVVGIHHPRGDLKMFSEGQAQGYARGPQFCQGVTCSTFQRDSYINVRWSPGKGTTERGSSGSGVFTFNSNCGGGVACYQLRGGLEGGAASCSNTAGIDRYSRMDLLFTRLAPYLAPGDIIPANDFSTNIVTEYYNPYFDYYFMSSRAGDKAVLNSGIRDSRGNLEWYPTGYWFKIDAFGSPITNSLTRYFIPNVARIGGTGEIRGTHFYTALPNEQQGISGSGFERLAPNCGGIPNGWFCNEGVEGFVFPIIGAGLPATCASGERKIWRTFRGNPAGDGNHRYVTNQGMYNYMVNELGWNGENVNLCVRP